MAFYDNRGKKNTTGAESNGSFVDGRWVPGQSYGNDRNNPPPGGGKVWDGSQWVDMPNLNPNRPWSRTPAGGTRTGDPNERIDHQPGSASGSWRPGEYGWDENGNWVPLDRQNNRSMDFPGGDHVADDLAATSQMEDSRRAEEEQILGADPAYVQAKAAGDYKGMMRAKLRLKDQRAQAASGMTPEAWNNRFNTAWPVPRSRNGQYWYRPPGANGPNDPGQPGPTPPGVSSTASAQGGNQNQGGPTQVPSSLMNTQSGGSTNTSTQIQGRGPSNGLTDPNVQFSGKDTPARGGDFALANGPTQIPESLTGANRPGFEWRADRREALRDRDLARTNMDNAANSSAEQRLNQARWNSQGAGSLYDKFLAQEQAKMAARKAGGY